MWPFGLCTSGVCTVIFGLIYHGILSLLDCLRLLDCTWKHAACGVFAYLKYVPAVVKNPGTFLSTTKHKLTQLSPCDCRVRRKDFFPSHTHWNIMSHLCRSPHSLSFDMWFGGSTSMTSLRNNTWSTFGVCPGSLFLRSQPIDEHEGPSFSANIQHWTFPHRNSCQGHYEVDLHAAYARFGAHKQQGIQNGVNCVLCW